MNEGNCGGGGVRAQARVRLGVRVGGGGCSCDSDCGGTSYRCPVFGNVTAGSNLLLYCAPASQEKPQTGCLSGVSEFSWSGRAVATESKT